MKQIKVKVVDWWDNSFDDNFIIKALKKKFEVIESENPDYLIYSVFGYEHLEYDCIRILFIGENIAPDFNICDYAIGMNHIKFEDRYLYYPLFFIYENDLKRAIEKHKIKDISHKTKFCNYIFSNKNSSKIRGDFFEFLNKYKKVDSAGKDRNNINQVLPVEGDAKYNFMKNYKFSIAFENSSTNGYCTEKIIQAFAAGTIPIYWGDKHNPTGGGINKKSFININDYNDFDNALETIKILDNNDEQYLKMLQEKVFLDGYIEEKNKEFDNFIDNIFSQEINKAFRRKNESWYKIYNKNYIKAFKILKNIKKLNISNIKKYLKNSIKMNKT